MKIIFAAVVLVSLMAVILCNEEPTDEQIQCAISHATEIIEHCGNVEFSDNYVRFEISTLFNANIFLSCIAA